MSGGSRKFFYLGLLISAVAFVSFAGVTHAQTSLNLSTPLPGVGSQITFQECAPGQQNCSYTQLAQYIVALYRYGIVLAVALAMMMVMIGGFIWVTAAGASDRIGKAKEFITAALTGLVLALFSYMILFLVNPELTRLPAIRVSGIAQSDLPGPAPAATCTGTASVRCNSDYDQTTGITSCEWNGSACVPSAGACPTGFTMTIVQGCAERVLSSDSALPPGTVTGPSQRVIPPGGTQTGSAGQFKNLPTNGTQVTGEFGDDRSAGRDHAGVDFAAPARSPVYTVANGQIYKTGYEAGGWGNYIVVDNGGGTFTLYAHLNERPSLSSGTAVIAGQQIGRVGTSGESTGPSIHFEVYQDRNGNGVPDTQRGADNRRTSNDERVDPLPFLEGLF